MTAAGALDAARASGQARCETCIYYKEIALTHNTSEHIPVGICLRYPPQMVADGKSGQACPRVIAFHWCGEHRTREEMEGKSTG